MGGAFVALADDTDAIYWNPAGLALQTSRLFSLTHYQGFLGITQEYVGSVFPLRGLGTLGVNALYATVANVNLYDGFGIKVGQLANYDLVLDGALGLKWGRFLALGVGIKAFTSRLGTYSAAGGALDLGILVYDPKGRSLSAGIVLQNLGPPIKYTSKSDPLPVNLRMGVCYRFRPGSEHELKALMELSRLMFPNENLYLYTGVEYGYKNRYFLRAGHRFQRSTDKLSVGLGARGGDLRMDYALLPFGVLGLTHRVSVAYELAPAPAPKPTPVALPVSGPASKVSANASPPPLSLLESPVPPATPPVEGSATSQRLEGTRTMSVDSLLREAVALAKKEEFRSALNTLARAAQVEPQNAQIMRLMGTCYFHLGARVQALDAYSRALALNPGDQELRSLLEKLSKDR